MLRLLDLFSGIGGFSYAAEHLVGGFETVAFVEREPFCQGVLRKHWPAVPIHDDICTFEPELGSADVVCGGFPCQDISTAGKQAGIKQGTRSGLFYELMRVVCLVRPQFVVMENVSAILANGLDTVLGELAQAGFDAEWACIPASAVGACHQRDRWWLIAYPATSGFQESIQTGFSPNAAERGARLESVTGRGAANAANPQSGGRRARQGSSTQSAGCQGERASDDSEGSDAAYPKSERRREEGQFRPPQPAQWLAGSRKTSTDANSQRQQEQQPPSITSREGRISWGDAPQRVSPDWRGYLSKPVLCRGDDGLSGRVDRLKALGNAVVPQVAAIPLQRVKQLAGRE